MNEDSPTGRTNTDLDGGLELFFVGMTTHYTPRPVGLQHHHTISRHEAVIQHPHTSSLHYAVPQQRLSNATRQFAYPTQLAITQRTTQGDGGISFAEHLLRRKTPHGTIAAGYDATPADKALQLPAAKHILVSPLPSPGHIPPLQSAFTSESWQQCHSGQN